MKLKITCFSVDVAKNLKALISSEEIYNGVEAFRRKEVSYLSFDTTDECDAYIRYAQSHMDELGFIQVERKVLGEDDSKYEIVLHKDACVTPTPYSGSVMKPLNTVLPLDHNTISALNSIQGIEWICPEITGERYYSSDFIDFTGFRIEGLKLIDRPIVFSYNHNPYHNELHCRMVATVAVYLAKFYGVSDTDIALLELAAFLHDVGHSGGRSTDDVNINFVLDYIKDSKYVPQLTEAAMETLRGLIKATEFPRNTEVTFTELEQILQDADLIATSLCGDSTKYLIGLYEEHLNKRPALTLNEFYNEQVAFHGQCLNSLLNLQRSEVLMVEAVDETLGDLYRYCEANSETGEILDADPEYNKAYKKILKRLGNTLQFGGDALQVKLKEVGCKKVDYNMHIAHQIQFTFKYKGEKGVLNFTSDCSNSAVYPTHITLELSTDDNLNLKFLKRLNKALKK